METSSQIATAAQKVIEGSSRERFRLSLTQELLSQGATDAAIAAFRSQVDVSWLHRCVGLRCPTETAVRSLLAEAGLLASVATKENVPRVNLSTPDGRRVFPIPSCIKQRSRRTPMPTIAMPGIQLSSMRLDRNLMGVVIEFLEHPERACGLVEAASERQLLLTEGAASIILGDSFSRYSEERIRDRLREATKMKRADYFYLPDLADFNRDIKQGLTPNDPDSALILSPRMQARDGRWYRYTHEYRAIQDDLGNLYHVGRSIGVDPVPAPAAVLV